MTDELKRLISLCDSYNKASSECLSTMKAARTYASLNESIIKVEEYILSLIDKCEELNTTLNEEIDNNSDISDEDFVEITKAYNHLGYAALKLEKANKIYAYVYKALSGEVEIVSAKKETKVNMIGKTVKKIKA